MLLDLVVAERDAYEGANEDDDVDDVDGVHASEGDGAD